MMQGQVFDGCMPVFPIEKPPLVLVGVCASGKTTISRLLNAQGIRARSIAQEHSSVQNLFRHGEASLVVLLCADWESVHRRRRLSFDREFYRTEWRRLSQARQEANLVVHTDMFTAVEVAQIVAKWWKSWTG